MRKLVENGMFGAQRFRIMTAKLPEIEGVKVVIYDGTELDLSSSFKERAELARKRRKEGGTIVCWNISSDRLDKSELMIERNSQLLLLANECGGVTPVRHNIGEVIEDFDGEDLYVRGRYVYGSANFGSEEDCLGGRRRRRDIKDYEIVA